MRSRATIRVPSSRMMMRVTEPTMRSWAYWMPSSMLDWEEMRAATSSAMFTSPELMAVNCWFPIAPTVASAYTPRCDRTMMGWGSASLMIPKPTVPSRKGRSPSNLVRKGVFWIEWISRSKLPSSLRMTMPARRVPKWE